jgi:hypothetical protein
MAPKRPDRTPIRPRPTVVKTDTPADPLPPPQDAPRAAMRRVSLPLTDDGRVDLDRMHDSTRGTLKALLADRELAGKLGLLPQGDQSAATLPPFVGIALAQSLSALEVTIVGRLTKAPHALVVEIATLSPQEQMQVAPALLAVVNKYGATLFRRFGEEITLCLLLLSITTAKINAVNDALRQRERQPSQVVNFPSPPPPVVEPPDDPNAPPAS